MSHGRTGVVGSLVRWDDGRGLVMGALACTLYAGDKRRARAGRWRIPETTLQLAGLACGWPGGVLAQQLLRHKNRKNSFQALFWIFAVLNTVVLAFVIYELGLLR